VKVRTISALDSVWTTPSRYKVLVGGRSSGKSYSAAIHAMMSAREVELKILCLRQLQNSIRQSVYTLIKDLVYTYGFQDEFQFTISEIRHLRTGSIFKFMGISRNVDEVKSTEGIDIVWIEEAHAMTQEQWDVINPTIRKDNSEIWIIFNPQHRTDYVFQNFVEHPLKNSIVRHINYDENPFISATMHSVIAEAKEKDEEEYKHIYLGVPREGDDRSLFAYSDIENAMNGDLSGVDQSGVYSIACDVARYGKDKSVTTERNGHLIHQLKEYSKYSTMEFATVINNDYHRGQKPDAVIIDTIGVGAGVYDKLLQMGVRGVIEGNASMKPEDIKVYQNKRAEMYFGLKHFVEKGGKLPNDKDLKEELLALRYFYNQTSGKIQIISKDDLKEILGRSPDKSDSVALHFFRRVRPMSMRNNSNTQGNSTEWSVYD
jgi:phage terminase large subunit